ncbi:phenylacetaldehyde reductase-like isoform X1 [Andrographis paniculata]|uniref:phenylacetaldehyde reductase-like isoform X1 n=1 Tax=Andrographis paniculata TaxID=175694 RepID=UPI0021E93D5F|nr:phenylacetaldehyde reductase-like isoform X1 [Andrographis paniculata]
MSGVGISVCVTGASGYFASWLVKLLLERGYTVKATVRNLGDSSKIDHLKELEGADERLQLFEASLTEEGSFDSAFAGCDGVFHTASPCFFSCADPQAELIEPAVEGTLNVLKSCSKVASIRRVVLTSSIAALTTNRKPKGAGVLVDEAWFSDPEYCKEIKQWYVLSKTMAEAASWKFAEENGIDLVVLHPGFIIGPLLQPTLNFSSQLFIDLIKGHGEFPEYRCVDVRDAAYAHVAAFENPSASGRYPLVREGLTHSEMMELLHKLYPSITAPSSGSENSNDSFEVSKKRAESLGVSFTPLEASLKDTVESLKEKKFLTL